MRGTTVQTFNRLRIFIVLEAEQILSLYKEFKATTVDQFHQHFYARKVRKVVRNEVNCQGKCVEFNKKMVEMKFQLEMIWFGNACYIWTKH